MNLLIALRIRGMISDGTAELLGGATIRRRTADERPRRRTVRDDVSIWTASTRDVLAEESGDEEHGRSRSGQSRRHEQETVVPSTVQSDDQPVAAQCTTNHNDTTET